MAKVNYLDKGIASMQPVINATPRTAGDNANNVGNTGVTLREEKCLGYVNLRLKETDTLGKSIVKKILGVELAALNQVSANDEYSVLGFSPNEWLIITPQGGEALVVEELTNKLNDVHSLVCDVTGGTTKLNITGKHAQDLLEKGTYVDLHNSVFQVGTLYATQIAHAPAVIVKNADNDFTLIVRRSFSHHIANWAIDGAAEYGFEFS